jgi:hypothetical protein
MKCGNCKGDHATVAEVKKCHGISLIQERDVQTITVPAEFKTNNGINNLIPQGPAGPRKNAQQVARRIEEQDRNTALARQGKRHGFTSHCPRCVAGTHWPEDERDAQPSAHNQTRNDRLSDEPDEPEGRRNRYPGKCSACGIWIEADEGLLGDKVDGKFTVRHFPGKCQQKPDKVEVPESALHLSVSFPDVPEGHYAVKSLSGNNDLDFFRVDRPERGGVVKTYVKRVIGGKPDTNIRYSQYGTVLQAIMDAGIEESGTLYGVTLGHCRKCNRTLTDELSRSLGIGPDCRSGG